MPRRAMSRKSRHAFEGHGSKGHDQEGRTERVGGRAVDDHHLVLGGLLAPQQGGRRQPCDARVAGREPDAVQSAPETGNGWNGYAPWRFMTCTMRSYRVRDRPW